MFFKEIRSSIKRAFLLALMAGSFILLAGSLVESPYIQKKILKKVSTAIGYDIEAKDIELNVWNGIGISMSDLSARSKKGGEKFTASSVRLDLDVKSLLAGRIIPSSLYLSRPAIEFPWEQTYDINPFINRFLPEKIPLFWVPGIQSLVIEQGRILFIGARFNLEDFNLRTTRVNSSQSQLMVLSKGKIGFKGESAGFELNGRVMPPIAPDESLSVDLNIKTDKIPLNWFRWPASVPVKEGRLKTRVHVEGDPTDHLTMKGIIDLTGFRFEVIRIKKDRHKEFFIPEATFDFESIIMGDTIDVRPLKIMNDDIAIDLGLLFNLKGEGGPFLDLDFNSEVMEFETFKSLFPSSLPPPWLEDRLFPMFAAGNIKIKRFSLKGSIDQIRHISRPENRSIIEMVYECRGFEASGGGISTPFRNVSADISLKDGLFSVSGLNADFGDSHIKNSGLNIRDVFSPSRYYGIDLDGNFNIKELIGQKDMEVLSPNMSLRLDRLPDIAGRIIGRTSIGYQGGWGCPVILNGDFILKGVSLDKKELLFPVNFDEARVHIDDTGSDYVSGSGVWGDNPFKMSANFGIVNMAPYFKDGLVYANVDMNQVFSAFNLKDKIPLIFNETLPLNISLAVEGSGWSLKGGVKLEDTSMKLKGLTFSSPKGYTGNIVFELGIKPGEEMIDINSALLKLKDSSINMTGAFNLRTKRFEEISLDSSRLALKDLSVVSDKSEIFFGGILKGGLDISIPGQNRDEPNFYGQIEGTGLSFQADMNSLLISDCSFQADFSDKGASLNYCKLKTGESDFSLTGEITEWSGLNGDIKVHSDYLNLSDVLPKTDTPSGDSITDHLNLSVYLDISEGRWNKFAYGPSEADLVFKNGNLIINDCHIRLDHGALSLKGHVLKTPEKDMFFTGDVRIKDQPVDELIEGMGISYKGLKGDIAVDGSLSIKGREKADLLSGLSGSVDVLITKGLIKNPNIIIKVLDFLSLQKIFEQRPPDLKEKGLYFESISADANIEHGILKSENFVMRSPVLNAVAEGNADIPAKLIDCTLFAQPLGTIDSLVSKVPVIGYILTGENKSVMAYPFDVKGPFSDPYVTYVPFETMEGGIAGMLKRILLTPARIFNRIGNALKNNRENAAR